MGRTFGSHEARASREAARRSASGAVAEAGVGGAARLRSLTGHVTMDFRGERHHHRAISKNTLNAALRAMGFPADEVTGHGFRRRRGRCCTSRPDFSAYVTEAQLAHSVRDRRGQAYNRTEFVEQRREKLHAWADDLDQLRLGEVVAREQGKAGRA